MFNLCIYRLEKSQEAYFFSSFSSLFNALISLLDKSHRISDDCLLGCHQLLNLKKNDSRLVSPKGSGTFWSPVIFMSIFFVMSRF